MWLRHVVGPPWLRIMVVVSKIQSPIPKLDRFGLLGPIDDSSSPMTARRRYEFQKSELRTPNSDRVSSCLWTPPQYSLSDAEFTGFYEKSSTSIRCMLAMPADDRWREADSKILKRFCWGRYFFGGASRFLLGPLWPDLKRIDNIEWNPVRRGGTY